MKKHTVSTTFTKKINSIPLVKLCTAALLLVLLIFGKAFTQHQVQITHNPELDVVFYQFPEQGWYMFSLPQKVVDNSVAALFPTALGAFSFDNASYSYVAATHMFIGEGYWLAFDQETTVMIEGDLISEFSRSLDRGWHILGSVKDSVDYAQPDDDPDGSVVLPLYSWEGATQQYYNTNKIREGTGHWIAVLNECNVIVQSAAQGGAKTSETTDIQTFSEQFGSPPPPPYQLQENLKHIVPTSAVLHNYPNPFNAGTTITFQLTQDSPVTLTIHNVRGQKIRTLIESTRSSGLHKVQWDGRDDAGASSGSGIYFCRMHLGKSIKTIKMVLVE